MRRFGLLGDPVAHSLSPVMYRAAFDHMGVRAAYEAVRVPAGDTERLGRAMRELASTGGGNVTVPHKEEAARLADRLLPAAERTGACNCFWKDANDRIVGDNTDVGGFLAAVREIDGLSLSGARVLLLGAGGGARAVAVACAEAGAAEIEVRNRTPGRAERLIADLELASVARVSLPTASPGGRYDLVVNATRVGLTRRDPLPIALPGLRIRFAFDLVYSRDGTAWTRHAGDEGIPALDGLTMLVHQGLLSLELWLDAEALPVGLKERMLGAVGARRNTGPSG